MKKSYLFALIGILLGTGAPIGAVLLLAHGARLSLLLFLQQEWQIHGFFYGYMLFGTCLIFSLFGFFVGRGEDILIHKDEILSKEVLTDPLTDLGNHRFLHDTFKIEFRRHLKSRQPLSCLMMDLDFFKRVNDDHGHPFGDKILFLFAQIIRQCLRAGDVATRYGGEEFLCILPNCDKREAGIVAERIRNELAEETFRDGSRDVKITVSIGVVTTVESVETNHRAMIDAADKNLYEAKKRGRNQVVGTVIGQ